MRGLVWYGKENTFMVGMEKPDMMASTTSIAHPKLSKESKVPLAPPKDYSDRSGLPRFA